MVKFRIPNCFKSSENQLIYLLNYLLGISFISLLSFLLPSAVVLDLNGHKVYDYDFFAAVQKNSWDDFDQETKHRVFDDFIKNELVFCDALNLNVHFFPDVYIKLFDRRRQLLVNSYYERVVVRPFVNLNYLEETSKNIDRELFIHHLLGGFFKTFLL